jgi:hypothetical protein
LTKKKRKIKYSARCDLINLRDGGGTEGVGESETCTQWRLVAKS